MAVSNISPNADNYYIGRGIVWWKRANADGTPGGSWRDLGNAPACDFKAAIKNLDHFSSRYGLKVKDASVVIEANATLIVKLDEWTQSNLALAMLGDEAINPFMIMATPGLRGEIFFLGTGNIGAKVAAHFPAIQFNPTGTLSFISADKYGEIELTGDILLDPASVPSNLGGTGALGATPNFGTLDWNTTLTGPP